MPIWNHLNRKWDTFFLITPMRFIQLTGYSILINGFKSSFLHLGFSWFDKNHEDITICPNMLIWNYLNRKRDSFFLITHMRFIQFPGHSTLINGFKSSFLHLGSSWFDMNHEDIAICPNRLIWNHLSRKWNSFLLITPKIFIQLPGDSKLINVFKSSFLHPVW